MAQAPDGDETLIPDDAGKVLEELLDAQNHAKLLGLMLNIKPRDVEAILIKYKDPKEQLLHIILAFLEQAELRPTWRAIIDALKSPVVGLTALANEIETNHFSDLSASREASIEISAPAEVEVKSKQSTTSQLTPTSGKELCLCSTSEKVNERIAELKMMFDKLKSNVRDHLQKKQILVKKVADVLTSAAADEDGEHKVFVKSHVSVLFRAADVPELFGTMNFHWNYLNPPLLDHLVRNFKLEEVTGEMESYKSDLKHFREQTPLTEFCRTQKQRMLRVTPEFREIVAEFDWPKDETLMLEVVEQFRQKYASQYNLRDCAMMVAEIRPGSFIITWSIPESIVKVLMAKSARAVLKQFSVTRLNIDGVCVYRSLLENNPVVSSGPIDGASFGTTGTTKPKPAPGQAQQLPEDDYLYVEQPSEDFFCPVTMGLLLQPHLTSCCGNHLSQKAVNKIQGEGGACPLCKEKRWSTMLDKWFQRQVNSLRVFCCHEEKGCGWQGELGTYQSHVESCPVVEGSLMTEIQEVYKGEVRVSGTTPPVSSSKNQAAIFKEDFEREREYRERAAGEYDSEKMKLAAENEALRKKLQLEKASRIRLQNELTQGMQESKKMGSKYFTSRSTRRMKAPAAVGDVPSSPVEDDLLQSLRFVPTEHSSGGARCSQRYEWYQTTSYVIMEIMIPNVKDDDILVEFSEKWVKVFIDTGATPYRLSLHTCHKIIPKMCIMKCLKTKVELRMRKADGAHWSTLDERGKPPKISDKYFQKWDSLSEDTNGD